MCSHAGGAGEREDRSDNIFEFYNNQSYTAIMDEDLTKKYGSNWLMEVQDGAHGKVFCKGQPTHPLHLAATYRRVKSMQTLLSAGTDPEIRDPLGRTALHLVISGLPNFLTTLPKPDTKSQTAAIDVRRKAEACLQLLCEHGVNINAEVEGESRETALHLSVRHAAPSAVQILTRYGADVNAVDRSGMTPLHMAAGILHKDILANLIRQGADINMGVRHSGNTALHLAGMAMAIKTTETLDDDISCVSELLEHGADPNAESKAGMTPLHEACSMGNRVLVDLLLRYGANINKLSQAGENCLFLFLNHRPNVRSSSLLVKLVSLTSPLTVYNRSGHLPSTLTSPRFFKQRDRLLELTQQPRRLQDICKSDIYLKYVGGKKGDLKNILPKRLYDFVFNSWEDIHSISFVADDEQDSFNNILDITPS